MNGDTPSPGGVWLTKAELAAARGMSIEAANRLIRRRRWERLPGVDGRTRILVPRQWTEGRGADEDAAADVRPNTGTPPALRDDAAQAEIARLQSELAQAQAACATLERERDQERQAREAAEQALEDARQRAEQAEQKADALQQAKERRAAEDRAEQVSRDAAAAQLRRLTEAMAVRRGLSRWARLRQAWRGE